MNARRATDSVVQLGEAARFVKAIAQIVSQNLIPRLFLSSSVVMCW